MDSSSTGSHAGPTRSRSQQEEWANTLTHGFGLLLSLVGGSFLCWRAIAGDNMLLIVGSFVYVATLVCVYLASTLSHAISNEAWRFRWRVWDQGLIYLLIAGSYTGFSLPLLGIAQNRSLLILVWILALGCFLHRTVVRSQSDKNETISYVALSWVPIFTFYGSVALIPELAVFWLIAGGISYTGGVIFLVFDQRVPYFHAVWHLLVILGSGCHFLGIYHIVATTGANGRL